ncbi:tRNA 2-thiouridine(34) synthase MnmA [Bryobacter aggregatus]|uniref:tRNA 2-thiouridine(34) synthase MnmA n=1 Tax=Bryobacter aggregatus TaxID=360054 RepID=UPI0004E24A15|nr:tRNA 2-thiouridine(34) synthase MnmA [Bryobacter aggregatus]
MSEFAPIAVAMSGGVDSSVVAGLLKRQGQPIVGLTMQLWNQRRLPEIASDAATGRCCSIDDVYDARYVAQTLDIPYYVVNFEDRFEQHVVKPFVADYIAGKTPIPCTLCNNFIKFDQFLEMADGVGAHVIATGHYAQIRFDEATGRWQMLRSADATKDQTYFLWGLTQPQLARTIFPLGGMVKTEVRKLAEDLGLPVAIKPDSQEICFVPNGDYAAFIEAYTKEQGMDVTPAAGNIIHSDGRTLGEHDGVHHFTVGQRRGLNVAVGEPLYVIQTNPNTREVTVGKGDDLLRAEFRVGEINWISIAQPNEAIRAEVRIRNRHTPSPATIWPDGKVVFDTPQRAVTPGQAAVFYQGELVVGGGWIERDV